MCWQNILKQVITAHTASGDLRPHVLFSDFSDQLKASLTNSARDPEVVAFKSIACYRTGLDIATRHDTNELERVLIGITLRFEMTKTIRLADKVFNDFVVCTTLRIAGENGKPGTSASAPSR